MRIVHRTPHWIVLLALGACTAAHAQSSPPADVARFIAQREPCDHFRGEEAYDAARGRFLARQVRRHCTGTDRALAKLRATYRHDAGVTKLLAGYEWPIEGR